MEEKEKKRKAVEAKIAEIVEFCKREKLTAELVGAWVWVSFDEKPDEDTRQLLKDAGFRWIKKRGKWAHNCGIKCRAGKQNPWEKYDHRFISVAG